MNSFEGISCSNPENTKEKEEEKLSFDEAKLVYGNTENALIYRYTNLDSDTEQAFQEKRNSLPESLKEIDDYVLNLKKVDSNVKDVALNEIWKYRTERKTEPSCDKSALKKYVEIIEEQQKEKEEKEKSFNLEEKLSNNTASNYWSDVTAANKIDAIKRPESVLVCYKKVSSGLDAIIDEYCESEKSKNSIPTGDTYVILINLLDRKRKAENDVRTYERAKKLWEKYGSSYDRKNITPEFFLHLFKNESSNLDLEERKRKINELMNLITEENDNLHKLRNNTEYKESGENALVAEYSFINFCNENKLPTAKAFAYDDWKKGTDAIVRMPTEEGRQLLLSIDVTVLSKEQEIENVKLSSARKFVDIHYIPKVWATPDYQKSYEKCNTNYVRLDEKDREFIPRFVVVKDCTKEKANVWNMRDIYMQIYSQCSHYLKDRYFANSDTGKKMEDVRHAIEQKYPEVKTLYGELEQSLDNEMFSDATKKVINILSRKSVEEDRSF